jgi:hypothetical protein
MRERNDVSNQNTNKKPEYEQVANLGKSDKEMWNIWSNGKGSGTVAPNMLNGSAASVLSRLGNACL